MYEELFMSLTGVTATVEMIDPETARKYLSMNTKNARTIRRIAVSAYAEDIESGNWEFTGETISFREDGTLYDGQHRLAAIIKTQIPIPVLVVRGIPNRSRIADWGKTRSVSAICRQDNLVISNTMQGAVRILLSKLTPTNGVVPKGVQRAFIMNNYKALSEAQNITSSNANSIGRRAPVLLACYALRELHVVNDDILRDFFRIFNRGTVMSNEKRDPSAPLVLSRQISSEYHGVSGGPKYSNEQFNITVQAILDYKKNKNRQRRYSEKNEPNELLNVLFNTKVLNLEAS